MLDRKMIYSIMYALAATNGREKALFGDCAPLANEAFACSLAGEAFPELWYEVPLMGDPWFDLHVLTDRASLDGVALFPDGAKPCHPEVFEWFAEQPHGVRQLALSHDVSSGRSHDPAVQLLVNTEDPDVTCRFLEAAGQPNAAAAYRAFRKRLPQEWFACYTGVFPARPEVGLRVECIPSEEQVRAYERDASLLEAHLRQVGLDDLGETVVPRCQLLASMPFQLEFQFNVSPDGTAEPTLGASVRFSCPPGEELRKPFETEGAAGELMKQVESWDLADDRWRLFEDAMFAQRITFAGESILAFTYPAFVKLRWRNGSPLDAKAYFIAGLQPQ